MSTAHPLEAAIAQVGLAALARGLGVTHQAVRKWGRASRLPRTEWTGETGYAHAIEHLTGGTVTKLQLLSPWPELIGAEGAPAIPTEEARDAA